MKKVIIGMAIFIILAFTITIGLAHYSNHVKTNESGNDSYEWKLGMDSAEKGANRYGFYDENDLHTDSTNIEHNGVLFDFVTIDGLKDKKIEKSINDEIKNKVIEILDDKHVTTNDNFYINVCGNFQNILSIYIHVYDDEKTYMYTMNFDLTTGKQFSFEDVFVKGANLEGIISKVMRRSMTIDEYYNMLDDFYSTHDYFDDRDFIVSIDEDELYKKTLDFLSSKDKLFYVTPSYMTFIYEDYYYEVLFKDFSNDIAIYDKFDTAFSIFERNDIGYHDIINFSQRDHYYDTIKYGFVEKNLFVDVMQADFSMDKNYISEDSTMKIDNLKKISNENIKEVNAKIEQLRKTAKRNPDKMYIYFDTIDTRIANSSYFDDEYEEWIYTFGDLACITNNESSYVMPMSSYEKTGKDDLYNAYQERFYSGYIILYYDGEYADMSNYPEGLEIHNSVYEDASRYYDIYTCKEITSVFEIIKEDSDYLDIIAADIFEDVQSVMSYDDNAPIQSITYEEAYELAKNATLKVNDTGIRVYLNIEDGERYYIYANYDEFDSDMLVGRG